MLGVAAALVAGAVVLYLLLPLIQGQTASMERAAEEPDEVRAQRRVLLRGIRDAEYDFVTGKLDQADYETLKRDLAEEALQLIDGEDGSCPACSATVRGGARFCTECGTSLEVARPSDSDSGSDTHSGSRPGVTSGGERGRTP